MCNAMTKTNATYTVVADHCELKRGETFSVCPGPVSNGQLVLARIGKFRVLGRFFAAVEGCDWLIQPGRWIRISKPVHVLGAVNLEKGGANAT